MIASLPMYDWPELRPATDALWAAIARALRARGLRAPAALERDRPAGAQWRDPRLLLSQTCGYPYVTALRGVVRLVATPVYAAEGCAGPAYRSVILVRAGDPAEGLPALRGRLAAFNAADSQSGYAALRAAVAPLARAGRFFGGTVETGAHLASMAAVAEGRADCAAVDCVCWALAARHRPALVAMLRPLAWSALSPALPFVTAARRPDPELRALRAALNAALADPSAAKACRTLLIAGIEVLDDSAYEAIAAMEREAVAAGYPALR